MRNAVATLVASVVIASSGTSLAQTTYTPSFDPEQYQHSADPNAVALLDGARPLGRGDFSLGVAFHFARSPLTVCLRNPATDDCIEGCGGDIISSRFTSHLVGSYGLGRFDVRAALPIVLNQGTDFAPSPGMSELGSQGAADLLLGGRVQMAKVSDFAFAFDVGLSLPLNGGANFIGNSGAIVQPRVITDWRRKKFAVVAAFGYLWRQKQAQLANLYINDELTWSLGGEYQINPKLSAGISLFGRVGVVSDPSPMMDYAASPAEEERPSEFLLSSRYWIRESIAIEAGAGTAVSSGYGASDFRGLVAMRWVQRTETKQAPLIVDTDSDGIVDADDKCPNKPEDRDGFDDVDGCPDDDNDNDNDGISDNADKCPNKPEDMDDFEDSDGCPDEDNDGDGVTDKSDKCSNKPEDNFEDPDGCPDEDTDGDGIADRIDQCPNEKEVFNGRDDEDGCPDKAGGTVDVSSTVDTTRKLLFDLNKASIKPESTPYLLELVAALKAYSDISILIEGHTDGSGSEKHNQELSQARAEAVKAFFVKNGIAVERLEAVGRGESVPLVSKGKEKNRRVEFKLIK